MNKDQFAYLNENIVALEAERDRLKEEVARLIGCWTEIDRLKSENEKYWQDIEIRQKETQRLKVELANVYTPIDALCKERDAWKSKWETENNLACENFEKYLVWKHKANKLAEVLKDVRDNLKSDSPDMWQRVEEARFLKV